MQAGIEQFINMSLIGPTYATQSFASLNFMFFLIEGHITFRSSLDAKIHSDRDGRARGRRGGRQGGRSFHNPQSSLKPL